MRHNRLLPFLPALLILVTSGITWKKLRDSEDEIQYQLGHLGPTPADRHTAASRELSATFPRTEAQLGVELAGLEANISTEESALAELRNSTDELESRLAIDEGEIVTSFGRVEDMGRELGTLFEIYRTLESPLAEADGELQSERDAMLEQASQGFLKLVAWIPEIGQFENNPDEIAQLQSEALTQIFQLEPTQKESLRSLVAAHFSKMNENGLTAPSSPDLSGDGDPEVWRASRSDAIRALMLEIRPFVQADDPRFVRQFLPNLLNMGMGFNSSHFKNANSSVVSMALPNWPKVPW